MLMIFLIKIFSKFFFTMHFYLKTTLQDTISYKFVSKNSKKALKFCFLFAISLWSFAQIHPYYSGIDFNLNNNDLKTELSQLIITTHINILPYTSNSTTDVWDVLRLTDLEPTNSENVLLIYGWENNDNTFSTDRTRSKLSTCHTSSCAGLWVREHTYPRSLGTPNLGFENAGSDAHSLRPIDNNRNNSRGNNKFASGSGVSSYIPSSGTWYPGDEWKGDIARMMMYMYLRYPTQCLPTNVAVGSTSYSTFGDMVNILLEWNAEDPVGLHELNRNNVLEQIQGNRNPFIDNPYLATIIWNGPPATDTWDLQNLSVDNSNSDLQKVVIFPTVTTDYVEVFYTQSTTFQYEVYNQIGQIITSGNSSKTIDLTPYTPGLYFIVLVNNQQQNSFKVIKK